MKDKDVREYALKVLTNIRVYCETSHAAGYSEEVLAKVNEELEPIKDLCYSAIREIRGGHEET